jgi:putative transposase
MVAPCERAELAKQLIAATCEKQGIATGSLHANRGTSITSKPVALMLAGLAVTKTHIFFCTHFTNVQLSVQEPMS